VAVTVSRVSVVDRMVSKEYVQTAHPYDRDLAFLGVWIENRTFFQGPSVGDSNCVFPLARRDRYWSIGAGASRLEKKYACAHFGACLG
jgi:hypothetical protein